MKCKKYLLGDVCNFIDYRGKTPPKTTLGIPLVTAKIIKNGVIQEPQEFIDESFYEEWMRRGIPKKGDVIFTTEAPLGEVAKIRTDEKLAFAQRVIILEPNAEVLDSDYLFYALQDGVLKGRIESRSSGTTVIGIKAKELKQVEIDLPPIEIQKKIGKVLSVIDDKIAVNNDINKNLEEQAQALYNELFADSSFDATLADLGIIVGGSTPSKKHPEYYTDQGIAWITPKDLSNNSSKFIYHGENDITELGLSKCSASVMPSGTVLFSSRAPIGYIAVAANPTATNQGFKSVIPNDKIGTAFVYYFLKNNLTMIESMASGSTFKEVSASAMKAIPAFKPKSDKLCQFQNFCKPLFYHQQMLESENTRLAQLRDTLLPRLMYGEVDVSKIDI